MKHRILLSAERYLHAIFVSQWPEHLPPKIEAWLARFLLSSMNALRRIRFGVSCADCESCGFAQPYYRFDIVKKRDGLWVLECQDCIRFTNAFRGAFDRFYGKVA